MGKEVAKKEVLLPQATIKGRGFEHAIDKKDLIIPRAKLLQDLSPEVKDENSTLKPGQIINSLSREILPATFIPLFWSPTWIRFNPRNKEDRGYDSNYERGALIWMSRDPNDPRVLEEGEFGDNGESPLATKFINFFSIFIGHPMPIIVSFSKTSMKAGQRLLSLAKLTGGDMFGKRYNLTSKLMHKNNNNFYVLEATPIGLVANDSKEFKVSEILYNNYNEKPIEVHDIENIEEEKVVDVSSGA